MAKGTGRMVCGVAYLTKEEDRLLRKRIKKLREEFPESGLNMKQFLDAALRVGIEIELKAAGEETEAENHAEHE